MASYYLLLPLFILPLIFFLKSKSKYLLQKQIYKLPPGPWTLPIIGSIHHFIGRGLPHHALFDLSQRYGGLMFLQIGELPTVVVSSREAATEILKTHDLKFCSRPINATLNIITYDGKDIAFAPYGEYWREMRKTCVLELLSSKRVQSFRSIREEEVKGLIKQISSASGSKQLLDLGSLLLSLVNDVTLRSLMGSKTKDQDLILREIKNVSELSAGFNIANMFPSSRLAGMLGSNSVRKAKQLIHRMDNLFENILKEHKTKEADGGTKDLLSILLRLYDEDSQNNIISMESIKAIIFDVISAGTETSGSVLNWAMAELMKNPRTMKKAQTKIRQLFQGRKIISESDVVHLDFIHLIIKETMRLHPPLPLILPRECRETCNILGYDIPKGVVVIVNAWAIGRNSKYWRDAEKFKPERFAELDGSHVQSDGEDFEFIPFGAGRRKCPGVSFGSAIMELVLANLLYHFDWELPHEVSPDELDMTETFGTSARRKYPLLLRAVPYQC